MYTYYLHINTYTDIHTSDGDDSVDGFWSSMVTTKVDDATTSHKSCVDVARLTTDTGCCQGITAA